MVLSSHDKGWESEQTTNVEVGGKRPPKGAFMETVSKINLQSMSR